MIAIRRPSPIFPIAIVMCALICAPTLIPPLLVAQESTESSNEDLTKQEIIDLGVEQLLEIQNEDGAWPYEGVYRVNRKIPVGYRIGGTAICCEALLYATHGNME